MSELKKMTKLGGDVRKIAALLQAKAPKGHMLAYINPEEAALLKSRGGSGEPHADTGIPSFEELPDISFEGSGGDILPNVVEQNKDLYPGLLTPDVQTVFNPSGPAQFSFKSPDEVVSYLQQRDVAPAPVSAAPQISTPTFTPGQQAYFAGQEAVDASTGAATGLDRAVKLPAPTDTGLSKDTLTRLGLAGTLGALGSQTARRAQQAGQRGAQEMKALAQPYQVAGTEAQAKAQRGELLPVGQQSLEAVRAQIAQDIQRRGGVGAQQAAVQVENMRQQLLQQQYDYGLKLSGIGDNIALGAIRTGMQADQYVNQLTNNFYSNMAYIASGMSPGVRVGGTTQGAIA